MSPFAPIACSIAACSTIPLEPPELRSPGPAPASSIGPEVAVVGDHAETSAAATAIDGTLHVVLATHRANRRAGARHLTVRGGCVDDLGEIPDLGFNGSRDELSLVHGERGRLHLVAGRMHWVLDEHPWRLVPGDGLGLDRSWWADGAPFAAQDAALILVGGCLLGAYRVGGNQVGAPSRWDWQGGAGPGGAAVFPWPNLPDKAVLVEQCEAGTSAWVVEPETKAHVLEWELAGDDGGGIHLLYRTSEKASVAYARVAPGAARDELAPLVGTRIGEHPAEAQRLGGKIQLAVDPATGTALAGVVRQHSCWRVPGTAVTRQIRSGFIGEPVLLAEDVLDLRIAPAGGDAFHAVVRRSDYTLDRVAPLLYFQWREGAWSNPLDLGAATELVDLVEDGRGGAWALWWRGGDLVARHLSQPASTGSPPP